MKLELNKNFYEDNSFFFFFDSFGIEGEKHLLSVDNFFGKSDSFSTIKYFLHFFTNDIDFNFLEKNNKLIFFFLIFNKLFFKDHLRTLKRMLDNENTLSKLKIKFYLNFYFFSKRLYSFVFILKSISLLKFRK
jgi:hypothetical protein